MTARLLEAHAPDAPVAFGDGGERTAADLLRDAATLAGALPDPTDGSHVLLVFESDRYAFAAALLGAWAAGHAVALPANTRRDTVSAVLDRPEVVALLHDTPVGLDFRVQKLLEGPPAEPLEAPRLPAGDRVATVFTSGTTGEGRAWRKTAEQLLGEVDTLRRTFPVAAGARTVATVPPTHIYGLLFGVLLPLSTGGAFIRETPLLPEAVARRVRDFDARVLVGVPAHLRTLEALEAGALAPLERVFSSTAPLPEEVTRLVAERHGLGITEILGSTETGGIATRRRVDGEAWRALEGVGVDVDEGGRLLVTSPFLEPGTPTPYRTADLAEMGPDGSFLHRGRADGVVKVGGRRVSLPAMEALLRGLEGVRDAAVVAVPGTAGRDRRVLAAVAGSDWTVEGLREALSERFHPSTLPRRFRLVEALPREANGKLARARLLRLFDLRPDGRPPNRALEWGEAETAAEEGRTRRVVRARVPEDYAWFEGHFPGYPILAGVVQLHEVVLPCVRRARPDLGDLKRLGRVKFLGRIGPGDPVEVVLRWEDGGPPRVDFELRREGSACAAGRLTFEGGEAEA